MNLESIVKTLGPRFEVAARDGARALAELALPSDAAILDVGTGNANFAIFLALQGHQVLTGEPATDQSHYAGRDWMARAEQAGVADRIRFQHFDAASLPFDPASFDAVFFFGVFHHIPEELRAPALAEALRVIRSTGAVVFFEPNQRQLEIIRVDDPTHPPAANPSDYLTTSGVQAQRIEGERMDIYLYRKSA